MAEGEKEPLGIFPVGLIRKRLRKTSSETKIPRSLQEQMTKENLIIRQDLWNFIQEHKNRSKDEFGGWLLGQEIRRTDKIIMAIDLWNLLVQEKIRE